MYSFPVHWNIGISKFMQQRKIKKREDRMRYIRWVIGIIFLSLSTALLHYTLPQTDIVRVTNTYEKRIDFRSTELFWADGARDDSGNLVNRDIFFIETFTADGEPMVYRNEDTGWNWPPYFKFDTSSLQAKASNAKRQSDMDGPHWVAIKHYGWRSEFFSIWPNAVSIKPVSDPDVQQIPWLNVFLLFLLGATFWTIRVRWLRFRRRKIDPIFDRFDDEMDNALTTVKDLFKRK